MKKLVAICALSLSLMLAAAACGSDDKSVVGRWKDETGNTIMEFTQDGKLIVTTTINAKYEIDEQGNIVQRNASGDVVETSSFVRKGNDLTITTAEGKEIKLQKQ